MSPANDDVVNILNLPHDLIRTIIRVGLEDIDDMKAISPLWNTAVREHFSNKTHLPAIHYFRWSRNDSGNVVLTICISERFRKYFKEVEVDSGNLFTAPASSTRIINGIFGRCSCIHVLDLKIDFLNEETGVLTHAMIGVKIDKLLFKRTLDFKYFRHNIMGLVESSYVKRLVVIENELSANDFDAILSVFCQFLPCTSTIELLSHDLDDDDENSLLTQVLQQWDQNMHRLQHLTVQQQQQMRHNLVRDIQPQSARLQQYENSNNRDMWRAFKDFLNNSDQVVASMHETAQSDGRVQFWIEIVAKFVN